jgi:hypothetical protein
MPKQFYTEKDIEDLFHRGTKSLQVTDDVVLTELAYEKAKRLGMQLVTDRADNPPTAPVRPYLSEGHPAVQAKPTVVSPPSGTSVSSTGSPSMPAQPRVLPIEQRIRSAVIARLGNQVDAKLLDNIIHRVVKGMGLK